MPRIKPHARCITSYTEKRYMGSLYDEVSSPDLPRLSPDTTSTESTPVSKKTIPKLNAPSKQNRLFQNRERIILDIHGPYEDLKDVCSLLRTIPCMENHLSIELSRINEEDNYNDEEDIFTDCGRVIIVTFFKGTSSEIFLIHQLLQAKEIFEDYMLVDDGSNTMRNFPTFRYFWS